MAAVRRIVFTPLAAPQIVFNQLFKTNVYPAFCLPPVSKRNYIGSKRFKKMYERKQNKKLEIELEEKYGIPRITPFDSRAWFLRNYEKEMLVFQHRMDVVFKDSSILLSAFAHTTFTDELKVLSGFGGEDESNASFAPKISKTDLKVRHDLMNKLSDMPSTKLALIGYSTLLFTIKESIIRKFPNITTTLCSDLVTFLTSRDSINKLANNLAIAELMLTSNEIEKAENIDEDIHMNHSRQDIVCDTFYAVIGAIKKDLGHEAAVNFVNDIVTPLLDYEDLSSHVSMKEPHLELKNILSMHGVSGKTRARIIVETGIDTHFPVYYVGVYCNGHKVSEGSSYSAFTARQDAFKNAVFMCLENEVDFSKLKKRN